MPLARGGRSVPVYAYAGNNPINSTDPDGDEIRYWGSDNQMISASSSMEDLAAYALALDGIASATSSSDQFVADGARELQTTDRVVDIHVNSSLPSDRDGQTGPAFVGDHIRVDIGTAPASGVSDVVSHELGHAYFQYLSDSQPQARMSPAEFNQFSNEASIRFENAYRWQQGLDLLTRHDPSTPAGPTNPTIPVERRFLPRGPERPIQSWYSTWP